MNKIRIAQELLGIAKELTAEKIIGKSPIEYDSQTETSYNKTYQALLRKLMAKVHVSDQIQAAKEVYDKVSFINDAGITYEISVNTNAKKETDILTVKASGNGEKMTKKISPSMVPFMLG